MRSLWKALAPRVESLGVQVYLVRFDPQIKAATLSNREILLPRHTQALESELDVLNLTIGGLRFLRDGKVKGYNASITLRSNLSTFWNFTALLNQISAVNPNKPLYHGMPYHTPATGYFVSGVGIFLNAKSIDILLKASLNYHIPDDLVIANVLKKYLVMEENFAIGFNLNMCWKGFENREDLDWPKDCGGTPSGYRISSLNAATDIEWWKQLYVKFYAPIPAETMKCSPKR